MYKRQSTSDNQKLKIEVNDKVPVVVKTGRSYRKDAVNPNGADALLFYLPSPCKTESLGFVSSLKIMATALFQMWVVLSASG
ncbi:Uncharacterised protein [Yersinia enterocolitica]|nr:Uncharacterised protein [Yersinia enterocolitica]